jgi:hypothetical protein
MLSREKSKVLLRKPNSGPSWSISTTPAPVLGWPGPPGRHKAWPGGTPVRPHPHLGHAFHLGHGCYHEIDKSVPEVKIAPRMAPEPFAPQGPNPPQPAPPARRRRHPPARWPPPAVTGDRHGPGEPSELEAQPPHCVQELIPCRARFRGRRHPGPGRVARKRTHGASDRLRCRHTYGGATQFQLVHQVPSTHWPPPRPGPTLPRRPTRRPLRPAAPAPMPRGAPRHRRTRRGGPDSSRRTASAHVSPGGGRRRQPGGTHEGEDLVCAGNE